MTRIRRYWFAVHPDFKRPIGGVKQIHRLAELITETGRQAHLIQDSADFHPGWFTSDVNTISRTDWLNLSDLNPLNDTLILPETFLPLINSYHKSLPTVVFNQNGAYSFGSSSSKWFNPYKVIDAYSSASVSHVLCVSHHDYNLLTSGFCLPESKVSLIVNGLEQNTFSFPNKKRRQLAYMPRKNPCDSQVVAALLSKQSWFADWDLVPISNCTQTEVAQILQDSLFFLSFGHPEGFGLPVAEALACGCGLIGYSGLGGRELFSLAKDHQVGLEVGFGDWLGFVDAVNYFTRVFAESPDYLLLSLKKCSSAVLLSYNNNSMRESVVRALTAIEDSV